MKKMSKT